jgi:hypothetical protein
MVLRTVQTHNEERNLLNARQVASDNSCTRLADHSFLTDRKFKALVEAEFPTPRETASRIPQASVLVPVLCNLYINDAFTEPKLILFSSRTMPLFMRQRNMKVAFSATCNATSLRRSRGMSTQTQKSTKRKLGRSVFPSGVPDSTPQLKKWNFPSGNNETHLVSPSTRGWRRDGV